MQDLDMRMLQNPWYFKNSAGSTTGVKTDGSGPGISTLGRFDLSGAGIPLSGALTCTQLNTQINSLYDDIIVLRNELGTLRGNLNIVKDKKSEKELQNWGCKNAKNDVEAKRNLRINYNSCNNRTINSYIMPDMDIFIWGLKMLATF